MNDLERVAPRLARAHRQELEYRARRERARRRGLISLDIAMEEMIRSVRAMNRLYSARIRTMVEGRMRESGGL